MKQVKESINLGEFQKELEASARLFKSAETKLFHAQAAYLSAESRYVAAKKSLTNAVCTVGAQNKIPL